MQTRRIPSLAAALLGVLVGIAHAGNPAINCAVAKRKAAAKKMSNKLACVARAAAKGVAVDPACLTKEEAKFSAVFSKADAKGGCLQTGDAATVEGIVDGCVSTARNGLGLPGDPSGKTTCTAAKLKEVGKKLVAKMNCDAHSVQKQVAVDPVCLTKAEAKFTTGFTKAEAKKDGNCLTTSDTSTEEGNVDSCLSSITGAIPAPAPTTTTSTTTSTTTTTTQAPGTILKTVLTSTTGRFNFTATIGVGGANEACAALYPASHVCSLAELQSAQTAGDLAGRRDVDGTTVTSFWVIDATQPANLQCQTTIPWDYQTAHTGKFGQIVDLDNGAGTLGSVRSGSAQNVFCAGDSWVGCCQ